MILDPRGLPANPAQLVCSPPSLGFDDQGNILLANSIPPVLICRIIAAILTEMQRREGLKSAGGMTPTTGLQIQTPKGDLTLRPEEALGLAAVFVEAAGKVLYGDAQFSAGTST